VPLLQGNLTVSNRSGSLAGGHLRRAAYGVAEGSAGHRRRVGCRVACGYGAAAAGRSDRVDQVLSQSLTRRGFWPPGHPLAHGGGDGPAV